MTVATRAKPSIRISPEVAASIRHPMTLAREMAGGGSWGSRSVFVRTQAQQGAPMRRPVGQG
jgi:hypothetical protein